MNILGLTYRATKQVRVLVGLYDYLSRQSPDTAAGLELWQLAKRFGVSRPTMGKVLQRLEAHGLITVERLPRRTRITGWLHLLDKRWRVFIDEAFSQDAHNLYQNRRTYRRLTRRLYQAVKREIRLLRRFRYIQKICPPYTPKELKNPKIVIIYRAHGRHRIISRYGFGDRESRVYVNSMWVKAHRMYPKREGKGSFGRAYIVFLQLGQLISLDYVFREVKRYREYCDKRGWTGTRWVMTMRRFLQRILNRVLQRLRRGPRVPRVRVGADSEHNAAVIELLQRTRRRMEQEVGSWRRAADRYRQRLLMPQGPSLRARPLVPTPAKPTAKPPVESPMERSMVDSARNLLQSLQQRMRLDAPLPRTAVPTATDSPTATPAVIGQVEPPATPPVIPPAEVLVKCLKERMGCDTDIAERLLRAYGAERVYAMLNRAQVEEPGVSPLQARIRKKRAFRASE